MADAPATRPPFLRTSVRLSLQYTFLYAVLSACVFAMAYFFTQYEVQGWARDQMRGDAKTLRAIYAEGGRADLIATINALASVSFENARLYQLRDTGSDAGSDAGSGAGGATLAGNIVGALPAPLPDTIAADDLTLARPMDVEVDRYWMQQHAIGPYQLVQGTGNHLVAELLEALAWALVVGYILVIALGLIVGVRVGRITEARIVSISSTLDEVAAGHLAARVPTSAATHDDFARVSGDINAMLDQIARLLESQQQISNDIAHDMRTPLQRLRQRLEAMGTARTIDPAQVQAALQQTEDIIATFNSLLRIAQIGAERRRERFAPVNLADIANAVAELFEPAAEERAITLIASVAQTPLMVTGDRGLLTQLFSNLVENAIRHCPPGTTVRISGQTTPGHVVMRIADDGPGIDAADRARIFLRFFRVERARHSPGNGLGLALVKAIADMHGATVSVLDGQPGAIFEIGFPAA